NRPLRLGMPVAFLAMIVAGVVWWPRGFLRGLKLLLVLVSPVSLVVVEALVTSTSQADAIVSITNGQSAATVASSGCSPVLAVLFDELSFSYLYADGRVRPEYTGIGGLASEATNYLSVAAPGPETLISMP